MKPIPVDLCPPIPFIDLAKQQARLRPALDAAVARVFDHGQYIMGPEIADLERRLAAFCEARHAISCGSGTDALLLALMAKGLRPGEAVIVPSFTFCATAEAVCLLGGIPVFADVVEETYNLDPRNLESAILTSRELGLPLRGVITVDLFGHPCDYDPIEAITKENGLWLICDAAQSFGATYRGRRVGAIGDITTTSFFPAKPLGAYGDGGAIFTDDDELASMIRSLRVHGRGKDKYDNVRIGINGRLDTLQASILLEKLAIFEEEIAAREAVAARYAELLPESCRRPVLASGANSVWALYTIRTAGRDELLRRLTDQNVSTGVYYRCPLHKQPAYRDFPQTRTGLPVTTRLVGSVLSLPMHPYLAAEEQSRIAAILTGPDCGSL
jgi:dTDP-4-amino-4,6-dideoxygalactose transaminase